ncbi:MAG: hypothetical protein RIB84_03820 [Sneathiellaceae bacterium]
MADGDNIRIGNPGGGPVGPVQRIRQAARGRTRSNQDEGGTGSDQGFAFDDPGIRAGPRGGLPDWLGRNLNIYV